MKDERARDKAIEKLVARGLRREAAAPGADCLDAETLAAYVERTLVPREKVTCEAHLASCLPCQERVAQLVRASEDEAEVEPSRATLPSRVGLPGFRWAWAAPALVAVLVAGLWYTGEFRTFLRMRQETPVSAPSAPPPSPLPSPVEEGTRGGTPARPGGQAPPEKAEHREKEARVARPEAKTSASASARPVPTRAPAAGQGGGVSSGVGAGAVSAGAIATPTERARLAGAGLPATRAGEPATADERRDMGPPGISTLRRQQTQAPRAEAPARRGGPAAQPANAPERPKEQEQAADLLARQETGIATKAAGEKRAALSAKAGISAAMKSLVPVAGAWRVGPHGLIEKRTPEGDWMAVESGVKADLFAITFSTPATGWAVGAGGTVLRTTDAGVTWTKLAFPTTDDLVRVFAQDGRHARVETRAGQSFMTTNGGESWKPVP